jgi:hypothetical protein
MAKKNTRQVTNLNLTPELPQVTSRDFNLFYAPQKEPDIAGLKELTTALDSFINGAGAKAEIAGEIQQKAVNSAQAELDYNTNKQAFADKVKAGEIPLQANPYYIEKYKDLTLKSHASEFSTLLSQEYADKGISKYPDPNTFDNFYTATLKKFVADKGLSSFNPLELEKSFFQETSKFRNQLENVNRQSQIEKFKENFDIKMNVVILKTIDKHKGFGNSPVDDPNVDKFELIAKDINLELADLKSFGTNGKDLSILTRDALKTYVANVRPEDYKFAKQLVMQLPQYLSGGTDTFDKTAKAKALQDELMTVLNSKANEKFHTDNALNKGQQEKVSLESYNFLEEEKRNNPNFDVTAWLNSPERTSAEKKGGAEFIKDQTFDGGKTSNPDVLRKADLMLLNGDGNKAWDYLKEQFRAGQITSDVYRKYVKDHIPDAQKGEGNYALTNDFVRNDLQKIDSLIKDSKDKATLDDATEAKILLQRKITKWWSVNQDKLKGKNQYEVDNAIEGEWSRLRKEMKDVGRYPAMFGALENSLRYGNTTNVVENYDTAVAIKKAEVEQKQKQEQQIKNKNVQDQTAQSLYENKVRPKYSANKKKTNTRMFND